ncbi:hypothetical protein OROGR_017913 [Orobanche gracilis]
MLITEDLRAHNIDEAKLAELWYNERKNTKATEAMWGRGLLKNFQFSNGDYIRDYASKTYDLAHSILKGSEGGLGLGEFLAEEGFVVGKYYKVKKLLVSLKFFKVDACPTFIGHGAYHPSPFEVGVLATKDFSQRIPHLMVSEVPQEKFIMRHL